MLDVVTFSTFRFWLIYSLLSLAAVTLSLLDLILYWNLHKDDLWQSLLSSFLSLLKNMHAGWLVILVCHPGWMLLQYVQWALYLIYSDPVQIKPKKKLNYFLHQQHSFNYWFHKGITIQIEVVAGRKRHQATGEMKHDYSDILLFTTTVLWPLQEMTDHWLMAWNDAPLSSLAL